MNSKKSKIIPTPLLIFFFRIHSLCLHLPPPPRHSRARTYTAAQRTQNEKDKADSLRAQMRVQHEAFGAKNLLVDGVMGELATLAEATEATRLPHEV